MTDDEYKAWLKSDNATRIVIVEAVALVDGQERTFYLSNKGGYVTSATDTPANEVYKNILSVNVLYTEQMNFTSDTYLSVGELLVDNFRGERDAWVNYVWSNRPLRAWIGDPRWARADFRPIFAGTIADVAPRGSTHLVIKLRDKMQLLNTPVTDAKIGGTGQNKDVSSPVMLGECFNVTPVFKNEATLTYKYHTGAASGAIEVRDDGIPILVTEDAANGEFTLANQSFGTVTVSAQGHATGAYVNTVAQLVKVLATQYGNPLTRLTNDDIDLANFAAFDAAHPQPVGIYLTEAPNVLDVCKQLASSVGAQLTPDRYGKLKLVSIAAPDAVAVMEIRSNHIVDGSFVPTGRTEAVGSVKLGYCKNWTPQENLSEKIPQAHRDLMAKDWRTATKIDAAVQTQRKLNGDSELVETMLLRGVDAQAEAQRRLDFWKVPRTTYEFEGTPEVGTLNLGDTVKVFYHRYNMQNGVFARVIKLSIDWDNGHVNVGIMV